eukprot:gene9617-11784_t
MINNKIKIVIFTTIILSCLFFSSNAYNLDETILVRYLEAPLLSNMILGQLNAFHSGLGFQTLTTNEEYTVDFIARPSIITSIFPENVSDTDIIWDTWGTVRVLNYINDTYWSSRPKVMQITGEQFQQFLCWVPLYNETYPYYSLFDIRDNRTQELFTKSVTCNDFVWASFSTLYDLGAKIINQTLTKRDYVTLFVTEEPIRVYNPRDPANWNSLNTFYKNMIFQSNETASELIDHLIQMFSGEFFLYINGSYYNLTLAYTMPILAEYRQTNLPDGIRNPSGVQFKGGCLPRPKQSIGGGWIFFIIVVTTSTLYLVCGVIINKITGETGTNLIPNKQFWIHFGGLIADGARFIKNKITRQPSYKSIETFENL